MKYICAIIYFICWNLLAIGVVSAGVPASSDDAARPFSFSNNFDATPAGEEVYYPITAPFCQIYTSRFNIWRMSTEIIKFSTFKLGPCSSESFSKLSIASVIAQLNTFHDTIVDQIENVNHLTPLNSFALLTNAVLQGEADAMVSEYPVALSIVNNNPDLTMIQFNEGQGFELSFEDTTVSVATRLEDTELIDTINTVLSTLSQDTRNEMMATAIAQQPAE